MRGGLVWFEFDPWRDEEGSVLAVQRSFAHTKYAVVAPRAVAPAGAVPEKCLFFFAWLSFFPCERQAR